MQMMPPIDNLRFLSESEISGDRSLWLITLTWRSLWSEPPFLSMTFHKDRHGSQQKLPRKFYHSRGLKKPNESATKRSRRLQNN